MVTKAAAAAAPHTPKTASERPRTAAAEPHEPLTPAPPAAPASPPSLLTLEQLSEFAQAASPIDRLGILCTALRVAHYVANPRSLVWVDWCFSVLTFALEEAQLSARKTLALLGVANEVFDFATTAQVVATTDDGVATPPTTTQPAFPAVDAVYEVFRRHVRMCSVAGGASNAADELPVDVDAELWDPTDVAHIVSFMSSTFFRHLAAYQHVFQFPRQCLEREVALVVETPLLPTPLALATQE